MTNRDIEALLDKLRADPIQQEKHLGALAPLSRKEQINFFREKSDRQLLVALLEAKQNKSFEAYIGAELEQLKKRFEQGLSCVHSRERVTPLGSAYATVFIGPVVAKHFC